MSTPDRDPLPVRVSLTILRAARRLVPTSLRHEWMREWEAEVRHQPRRAHLVRRSGGAVVDAAWLRQQFTADLDVVQDARLAVRVMRRRPLLSTLAVLVLALGIAGTLTVFSTVDTLLLRTLPYADENRIVTLWQSTTGEPDAREGVAPGIYLDWRERLRSYSHFAAAEPFAWDYLTGREPVTINGALVTAGFFEALGTQPVVGRLFRTDEYQEGRADVVLLSYGGWQRIFGGDRAIVGRTVQLEGRPHLIVGVLPRWFHPALPPSDNTERTFDLWGPHPNPGRMSQARTRPYWGTVGRLKPGVGVEQARAELATVTAQILRDTANTPRDIATAVVPLRDYLAGPIRPPLMLLMAAVVAVLLIGCANVASLLLASSVERQREFALRAAIGAARWRLMRQTLVEASVLAALACGLGVALAYVAIRGFVAFAASLVPQLSDVALDPRLAVIAVAIGAGTALLVGIWPAIQLSRGALHAGLRENAAGITASTHRRRAASSLIVAEVALALVLLMGAGLLVRSFTSLVRVDPGFAASDVATVQVFAYGERYASDEARLAFFDQTLDRLRAMPGVVRAGVVSALPFSPSGIDIRGPLHVEGRPEVPVIERPRVALTIANAGYFQAMRIPLRSGRMFAETDHSQAPLVALVSDRLAQRQWGGESPIGRRITVIWLGNPRRLEVVGVVGSLRHTGFDSELREEVFMPLPQMPYGSLTFVAQAASNPAALIPAMKAAVWEGDPTLPIYEASTIDAFVVRTVAPRLFIMQVTTALSGLAFLLAALGIYGMLSFSTAQRTREIGVRVAMGGGRADILRLVMRQGLALVAAGIFAGVAVALPLRGLIAALLFGVSPWDPLTLAGTIALLVAVAALACYIPARRAMRIDPLLALRSQ